jgi:ribosome-associated protein
MSSDSSFVLATGMRIPIAELDFTYARSSGPGGQNVNKVNSKAVMHWDVIRSPTLPQAVRIRLIETYGSRINSEGFLVIASDVYRDRTRNQDDCIRRLAEMLETVARPPKIRRATKPTKGSERRREAGKRQQSEKKKGRSGNWD